MECGILIIASVPHTGSHFLIDLIGYEVMRDKADIRHEVERNQRVYRFHHVYDGESMEWLLKYGNIAPVISPLRHPMSVAQSWKNRGKPIDKHEVHAPMVRLFQNLIDLSKKVNMRFLPLDSPDRDQYLRRISDVARRNFKTQWAYYGPGPVNPTVPLTQSDRDAVDNLMTDPFFRLYYGQ